MNTMSRLSISNTPMTRQALGSDWQFLYLRALKGPSFAQVGHFGQSSNTGTRQNYNMCGLTEVILMH